MRHLIILLLCLPLASGLEFSEIMFDAAGSDNGKEFVELTGTEDLAGCTITDSFSSDELMRVQAGSDIILIVEENAVITWPAGISVYHAGAAIGNGLGNSGDELTITCPDDEWSTSYVPPDGFEPGTSIVWRDGWTAANATPGTVPRERDVLEPEPPAAARRKYCDTTLIIEVSDTIARAGEDFRFALESAGFASFTVEANGSVILEGDTLTEDSYAFMVPDVEEVVLTAYASACDAEQRAKRIVPVLPRQNTSVRTPVQANLTKPEPPEELPILLPEPEVEVVYDEDAGMVPWIIAFGAITLFLATGLYWYETR